MPDWVKDEATWAKAKEAALKDHKESDDGFYAIVTQIYKRMGGKVAKAKSKAKASAAAELDTVKAKAGADDAVTVVENDDPDAIHCRAAAGVALAAPEPWRQDEPVKFVYAPEGVHTITAGFRDGRITLTVVVDEATPAALQASFASVASKRSQTPFADEEHEAHKATLRFPKDGTRFEWGQVKDAVGVVLAGGLPTSYGAEAVNGRTYESWSPEFLTDADYGKAKVSDDGHYTFPDGVRGSASNPARLVGVGFTIGALTNKPAFHMMPPVKAGDAAKATDDSAKVEDGQTVTAAWSDAAREASAEARRMHAEDLSYMAHKRSKSADEGPHSSVAHSYTAGLHREAAKAHLKMGHTDRAAEHEAKAKHHEEKAKIRAADATSSDGVKAASPGLGFCKLAGLAAGLQVAHWAADTVTNAHKAIGDLYETVSAKVDEFAEVYSGKTGEVPLAGESCEVRAVGDHGELIEQGLGVVDEVRAMLSDGDDDLLNILADVEAAYNKARYLLKASDAGEREETVTMTDKDGNEVGKVTLSPKKEGETVTAAGTSEGAKKGWEHRNHEWYKAAGIRSEAVADYETNFVKHASVIGSRMAHREAALRHNSAADAWDASAQLASNELNMDARNAYKARSDAHRGQAKRHAKKDKDAGPTSDREPWLETFKTSDASGSETVTATTVLPTASDILDRVLRHTVGLSGDKFDETDYAVLAKQADDQGREAAAWVADAGLWRRAKDAVLAAGRRKDDTRYWQDVMAHYRKLGGRTADGAKAEPASAADALDAVLAGKTAVAAQRESAVDAVLASKASADGAVDGALAKVAAPQDTPERILARLRPVAHYDFVPDGTNG